MTSQITSHIEVFTTNTILFLCLFCNRNWWKMYLYWRFQYDLIMILDSDLLFWGHRVSGVGYGALIAAAWLNVFYIVVLAWAIYYLVASMTTELPWASCNHWWNTANCRSYYDFCAPGSNASDCDRPSFTTQNFTSPVREYWEYVPRSHRRCPTERHFTDSVISANNVHAFKNGLYKFWANRELIFDCKSTLTGRGSRSFIYSSDIIDF